MRSGYTDLHVALLLNAQRQEVMLLGCRVKSGVRDFGCKWDGSRRADRATDRTGDSLNVRLETFAEWADTR